MAAELIVAQPQEDALHTVVEITTGDAVRGVDSIACLTLPHDLRRIRRKVLELGDGRRVLLDLPEARTLHHGDALLLDDGSCVLIEAAEEDLFVVRGRDSIHLTQLAWHIGNRHLAAEIHGDRVLILKDHVIRDMLERLGATVEVTRAPFVPVRGAYATSAAGHGHDHEHHHHHDGHHA